MNLPPPGPLSGQLLMYDALVCTFRTIKLRPQQPQCAVCGENPSIMELIDYELFCGSRADDKSCHVSILSDDERMSCKEYVGVVNSSRPHLLLDVREPVEFEICHLPKSLSIQTSKNLLHNLLITFLDYYNFRLSSTQS